MGGEDGAREGEWIVEVKRRWMEMGSGGEEEMEAANSLYAYTSCSAILSHVYMHTTHRHVRVA